MKKLFNKYEYTDPLRYVNGQFINLERLTEKELDALNKKNPELIKLIKTAELIEVETPQTPKTTKKSKSKGE